MLLDHAALAFGLFRQLAITRFASCSLLVFPAPIPVYECLLSAYDAIHTDGIEREAVSSLCLQLLVSKSAMLQDYFGIDINGDGSLVSIPDLLPGYTPCLHELPLFLWQLSQLPNWDEEEQCFGGISNCLGAFYAALPDEATIDASSSSYEERILGPKGQEILEQTFLPAIRQLLIPDRTYESLGIVSTLASLEQLYKIFERC